MTPMILGQILGVSVACGLNLYLTVAALGLLARLGILQDLPPGLHGLEGIIVIGSAIALYVVEAVVDKVGHADSLWDTVHTFIRPPAAALLAVAALWGQPPTLMAGAAALALAVAFVVHGTKAGIRVTLNTGTVSGHVWVSIAEDLLAVAFAVTAFLDPSIALIGTGVVLAALLLLGPRYWRAFRLGLRAMGAWLRTLFAPARWREEDELPRGVRKLLDPTPLGAAPPRGARGALHGLPGAGPYRNGWMLVTGNGAVFVYRTLFGHRRVDLPTAERVRVDSGVWADVVDIEAAGETTYRLFMLKDGPPLDLAVPHIQRTDP